MSTIKIENRANAQGQREKTTEEFINEYKTVLENTPSFSDILYLSLNIFTTSCVSTAFADRNC